LSSSVNQHYSEYVPKFAALKYYTECESFYGVQCFKNLYLVSSHLKYCFRIVWVLRMLKPS